MEIFNFPKKMNPDQYLMNDFSEHQEPLKLSDEQLRTELNWDRDRAQNYSKRIKSPEKGYNLWIIPLNSRQHIREMEILIKPDLNFNSWSSLREMISFYHL